MSLCRHSVGISENELTRNSSGNTRPQSSQLAEPLWTDPGLRSGISVRNLISILKKKVQAGNAMSNIFPKSSHARNKATNTGSGGLKVGHVFEQTVETTCCPSRRISARIRAGTSMLMVRATTPASRPSSSKRCGTPPGPARTTSSVSYPRKSTSGE